LRLLLTPEADTAAAAGIWDFGLTPSASRLMRGGLLLRLGALLAAGLDAETAAGVLDFGLTSSVSRLMRGRFLLWLGALPAAGLDAAGIWDSGLRAGSSVGIWGLGSIRKSTARLRIFWHQAVTDSSSVGFSLVGFQRSQSASNHMEFFVLSSAVVACSGDCNA